MIHNIQKKYVYIQCVTCAFYEFAQPERGVGVVGKGCLQLAWLTPDLLDRPSSFFFHPLLLRVMAAPLLTGTRCIRWAVCAGIDASR